MRPIYSPSIGELPTNSYLLLDTCTIIEMLKNEQVCEAIRDLAKSGCSLLSISPVKDELTYGANSIKEYDDISNFISSQEIIILDDIRRAGHNHDIETVRIAISRCGRINPSYVDRILLSIPYFYRKNSEKIYLVTLNHKDVPLEFYECIGMISYCKDRTFRNIGFYEFDCGKFEKLTKDVAEKLADTE